MSLPATTEFAEKMMEEFKEQRKIHKKYSIIDTITTVSLTQNLN